MFQPGQRIKERIGEVVEGDGRLVALAVARARVCAALGRRIAAPAGAAVGGGGNGNRGGSRKTVRPVGAGSG